MTEREGIENIIIEKAKSLSTLFDNHFKNIQLGNLHPEAYEPVNYFLQSEGKRIRPLLLLLSCDAFGGNVKSALDPAFGIELFHNFTLIHDDIMDKAEIRRGRPTLHQKFTEGTAILAGDFLLILAYRFLSKVDQQHLSPILETFNKAAIQIIEGQVLDAAFEETQHVHEQEYLTMIKNKTSVLLGTSLKIGAILSNASNQDQENIYQFGINLGMAFQLKDDFLDVYGDQKLGKKIGGDILRNKKTYLFIKAIDSGNQQQKSDLLNLVNVAEDDLKISEAIRIYDQLNVGEETEGSMIRFYERALTYLDKLSIKSESKTELKYFAERIYKRGY